MFSIIQLKVIKPADFADLAVLGDRLERSPDRYNQSSTPSDRRFTTADLAPKLERVDGPDDEPVLAA